jgi:Uma2 family endonuclease
MSVTRRLLTAEEFLCLPDPPEGGKMELVCGEVVTMAPANALHGGLAIRVGLFLLRFVDEHQLGEVMAEAGYILARDPDVVREPDASFLERSRVPEGGLPEKFIEGPPTLAVEVRSPSDRTTEVQRKVRQYLEAGTARVWVVRPEAQTVTVHRPDGSARTYAREASLSSDDAGFTVEGFALPLSALFR